MGRRHRDISPIEYHALLLLPPGNGGGAGVAVNVGIFEYIYIYIYGISAVMDKHTHTCMSA